MRREAGNCHLPSLIAAKAFRSLPLNMSTSLSEQPPAMTQPWMCQSTHFQGKPGIHLFREKFKSSITFTFLIYNSPDWVERSGRVKVQSFVSKALNWLLKELGSSTSESEAHNSLRI